MVPVLKLYPLQKKMIIAMKQLARFIGSYKGKNQVHHKSERSLRSCLVSIIWAGGGGGGGGGGGVATKHTIGKLSERERALF